MRDITNTLPSWKVFATIFHYFFTAKKEKNKFTQMDVPVIFFLYCKNGWVRVTLKKFPNKYLSQLRSTFRILFNGERYLLGNFLKVTLTQKYCFCKESHKISQLSSYDPSLQNLKWKEFFWVFLKFLIFFGFFLNF